MEPPPAYLTAEQCVTLLLAQAQRLGVLVRWQQPLVSTALEAAYQALPGQPGVLELRAQASAPASPELCSLISHEMVHVLQHWRGQLQALLPLGWPIDGAPPGRLLSLHEAEAYTAQGQPQLVLAALRHLQPPSGRGSQIQLKP